MWGIRYLVIVIGEKRDLFVGYCRVVEMWYIEGIVDGFFVLVFVVNKVVFFFVVVIVLGFVDLLVFIDFRRVWLREKRNRYEFDGSCNIYVCYNKIVWNVVIIILL